jgi:hypothetical protein
MNERRDDADREEPREEPHEPALRIGEESTFDMYGAIGHRPIIEGPPEEPSPIQLGRHVGEEQRLRALIALVGGTLIVLAAAVFVAQGLAESTELLITIGVVGLLLGVTTVLGGLAMWRRA